MNSLKFLAKKIVPDFMISFLRKKRVRLKGYLYKKDLTKLARIHQSDKWGKHFYTPHYQRHFEKFRDRRVRVLEIGVGGNKSSLHGGASLRMWKDYFRKGDIYGIDIHDKSSLEEKRIKIFKGSQDDKHFLKELVTITGELDLIVDDGSHMNDHIIKSFEMLFPKLKTGGIYVVEDVQTSYWEYFGGSSKDLKKSGTAMNYFKSLADGINYKEFMLNNFKPSYFNQNITSIHFYHNLIFIYKGENSEPSSYLIDNQIPN